MNQKQNPCPICDGQNFDWGETWGVRFLPGGLSWLAKQFNKQVKMKARVCRTCGNVQSFYHQDHEAGS